MLTVHDSIYIFMHRALAVGLDGTLYSASWDKTIKVWNADGTCVRTLKGHTKWGSALAVAPDGTLYWGSDDKTIKVWNTADGKLLKTLKGHTDPVQSLALGPDGTLYSGSKDKTIKVWKPWVVECNLQGVPSIKRRRTSHEKIVEVLSTAAEEIRTNGVRLAEVLSTTAEMLSTEIEGN